MDWPPEQKKTSNVERCMAVSVSSTVAITRVSQWVSCEIRRISFIS